MDLLERDLRELGRARAPAGFAGRVLAAVGLADSYAEVDTPIGPYFLAWNDRGISAVMDASSGSDRFERWVEADMGRPPTPGAAVPDPPPGAAPGPGATRRPGLRPPEL